MSTIEKELRQIERELNRELIVKMLNNGETLTFIRQITHVGGPTIKRIAQEKGIHLHLRRGPKKKPKQPKPKKEKKDTKKADALVADMVREKQPEWEYVDGYTGCDGRLNLRHKACGYIYNMSSVSVRKGNHLRCEHCEQEKQKQLKAERKERKRIEKIVTHFNQPAPKGEQLQAKTCPDCGAFYFPKRSDSKACPDCQKKRINRYYSRKKDLKKHRSQTGDSNQISARTVYERDHGICWICGCMCDINADPNSDWYPSVDHIVEQAQGGLDKWDNVRCAHRYCNSVRGCGRNLDDVRKKIAPVVPPELKGPWGPGRGVEKNI